jgi:predicted alpha/beta hydrolase family esterase
MDSHKGNVVLLHGRWPERIQGRLIADIPSCDSNNPMNWMGWTKERLEEKGYKVHCPNIADAWKAPYGDWKRVLDGLGVDENTILVGLSQGAYALLRWLGESGQMVRKLILIAPASKLIVEDKNHELMPFEKEFYEYETTSAIQPQVKEGTTIIVSRDDWPVIHESIEMYQKVLDAKVIKLDGLGHFSFLIPQLPELLDEIER